MNEGGTKIKGGQMVRYLDIPSDAGAGYGLFENLHGAPTADVFSTALQTATQTYYGTAFPAFITALLDNEFATIKETLAKAIKQFQGQESRGHNSSALVLRFTQTGAQVANVTFHYVGTGGSGIEALVRGLAAQANGDIVAVGDQITFTQTGSVIVNGLARLQLSYLFTA